MPGAMEEQTCWLEEGAPAPVRRSWAGVAKKAAGVASVLGLVGAAAFAAGRHAGAVAPASASVELVAQKYDAPINFVPSRPACSKAKDNCLDTGCCVTAGAKCFNTLPGHGFCNMTCSGHGYSCEPVPNKTLPAVYHPGTTMYCFAVYTLNAGTPKKPPHDLELLQMQIKKGWSLFACDAWDVFADTTAELAPGIFTIPVEDVNNEFHLAKRKHTGTWVNWGIFLQVWHKVRDLGKFWNKDWVVKVDADAVFLPQRLKKWLAPKAVTERGVYYENCPGVDSGFFGNTEVISHDAAAIYVALLEDCHTAFAECAKTGCDWEYGPWGEDVFAQRCMDRGRVTKVEAFDLTTDAACPLDHPKGQEKNKKWRPDCAKTCTPAMHFFKEPKAYEECMEKTLAASCP